MPDLTSCKLRTDEFQRLEGLKTMVMNDNIRYKFRINTEYDLFRAIEEHYESLKNPSASELDSIKRYCIPGVFNSLYSYDTRVWLMGNLVRFMYGVDMEFTSISEECAKFIINEFGWVVDTLVLIDCLKDDDTKIVRDKIIEMLINLLRVDTYLKTTYISGLSILTVMASYFNGAIMYY